LLIVGRVRSVPSVGTVKPAPLNRDFRLAAALCPKLAGFPDYYALPSWTNIYDTEPLRQTLSGLVDLKALADPAAVPGLLVSATDVEAGEIAYSTSSRAAACRRRFP
jgi:hypothetical protein